MEIREMQCLNIRPAIYIKIKSCFDKLFSIAVLLFFSPVWLVIAMLVKLTSRGSILFLHKRLGYQGKKFDVYKFRTMAENSEVCTKYFTFEQLAEYMENYKVKNDPRITPLGNILRKTSLDEIPQFINVLKGEMSIVGPRPITKDELCKYGDKDDLLLSIKPGITGLWQVSGRNNTTYEERVKLDIKYVNEVNFKLDVIIFFKTFVKVLKREGAY